jgi:integrase
MSRVLNKLSAQSVNAAKLEDKARKLSDGGGLFLYIKKGGKYWHFKYRFVGKERQISFGVFPSVSLSLARNRRDEARELLARGIDPSANRKAIKASQKEAFGNSFELLAREWLEQVQKHRVSPVHFNDCKSRLESYAFPAYGSRPVSEITAREVLDLLQTLERQNKSETAKKVKILCGQVFRYAAQTGRAQYDVTACLKDVLRPSNPRHHPAIIDPDELAELLKVMDNYCGHPSTCAALQLSALLFVRPGEIRQAQWKDIDLGIGEWNYTPSKGGLPLITPLPSQAIKILRKQKFISSNSEFVFPSVRSSKRPLSDNTVNYALQGMGYKDKMTAHGFRATARTILAEKLNFPIEHIEMQLGHNVKDANGRAYNRTTYFEQRKLMLQKWADYLDSLKHRGNSVLRSVA